MEINKIALVRREPGQRSVYSGFSHPGLALPIIGTILRDQGGFQVVIYIEGIQTPTLEELAKNDVVGFSINSAAFMETYEMARRLREISGCIIVFGGPHVSFLPNEGLNHSDYVIRSEGETSMLQLMKALQKNEKDLGHIDGLSWKNERREVIHNKDRGFEPNIDTIPDHNLIVNYRKKMRSFSEKLMAHGMLVSSTRGCSFSCNFCTIPQTFGQKIRYRDPEIVIEDIRRQLEFSGNKYIYFADDNFAINPNYTTRLLEKCIESGIKMKFSAQVRSEITRNEKLMSLLAKSGCYLVFVGYESINDHTLKAYNKGGQQSRRQMSESVAVFHKYGIKVHGMFVVGADTDESGVAKETAAWAVENQLDSLQILPVTPLPGTEVIVNLKKNNRVFTRKSSLIPDGEYIPYGSGNYVLHKPRNMSATSLQEDLIDAYSHFYSYKEIIKLIPKSLKRGLEPLIYRVWGNKILKNAIPQIIDHLNWLKTIDLVDQ